MRALLAHNPHATKSRPALTRRVAEPLASELELEVAATARRDHATDLAAEAVARAWTSCDGARSTEKPAPARASR